MNNDIDWEGGERPPSLVELFEDVGIITSASLHFSGDYGRQDEEYVVEVLVERGKDQMASELGNISQSVIGMLGPAKTYPTEYTRTNPVIGRHTLGTRHTEYVNSDRHTATYRGKVVYA